MSKKRIYSFLNQPDQSNYKRPKSYNIKKHAMTNLEHLNYGASTSSPHGTTGASLNSNMQIISAPLDTPLNTSYLDLVDCKYCCQYCDALFWLNERSNHSSPPKYTLCCQKGKIKLPLLKESPPILNTLLNCYAGPESVYYKKNIRTLNSMLAFTSFGANIDSNINTLHGPYVFKISGQVHHLLGFV